MQDRKLTSAAALTCFIAVAAGAFGAHALAETLQGKPGDWFDTAVQYQFFHGIGALLCGVLTRSIGLSAKRAGWLMLFGVLIFSGSLYAMAFGGPRWLGAVTPLGGLSFLLGWATLAWAAWRAG